MRATSGRSWTRSTRSRRHCTRWPHASPRGGCLSAACDPVCFIAFGLATRMVSLGALQPLRGTMRRHLLSLAAVTLFTMPAFAMSGHDVRVALEQRFKGDRTGTCVAAAVIDNGTTASAYFCADPKSERPYDEHTAFEI